MKKNICIFGKGFITWSGGIDFLTNQINALYKISDKNLNIFLLIPRINFFKTLLFNIYLFLKNIIKQSKIPYYNFNQTTTSIGFSEELINKVTVIYYKDTKFELKKTLYKIQSDILYPVLPFYKLNSNFPFKWIGYIDDFQFMYYPNFFSKKTCRKRYLDRKWLLENCENIVVNSLEVKSDIEKFYNNYKAKIHSLPFSPISEIEWIINNDSDIKIKYKLPEKYFMISNQFWKHKSHKTAFEALKILSGKLPDTKIYIVCTGKNYDHRFPEYFNELINYSKSLQIFENILFLGVLPKIDQIMIMKESLAVLQPSLFEGGPGGGSVFDAISLGITVIMSDININLEIKNEENVYYFKKECAEDLSDKMLFTFNNCILKKSNTELLNKRNENIEKLGYYLLDKVFNII